MPIDTYSPCPGGTGKKVKFCCPDFLGELQKIERMLDGDQHAACLSYLEQLEKQRADRACLLAIKSMLLRLDGQTEAAEATVAAFLEHHPDNPVALAESAILRAASGEGHQAMEMLQRAIAAAGQDMPTRVYDAIGAVAQVLLAEGCVLAARALFALQVMVDPEDRQAMGMLIRLNRSPSVPLLVRDDRAMGDCPDDVPWKVPFGEAMASVEAARWSESAAKLSSLAEQVPDAPVIWRNLAVLRGWLADEPGCVEALRRYASLNIPQEDAVEAEALALCLLDDPFGDERDVSTLCYDVEDMDQLQAALTLAPQVVPWRVDPRRMAGEDQPPPKALYLLLDRPAPPSGQELTAQNVPNILAPVRLFGRQTDREARLEVMPAIDGDIAAARTILEELVGHGLRPDPSQEVEGRISASRSLTAHRCWFPDDAPPAQIVPLSDEKRRESLVSRWPELPLGLLDGKTPREAAVQPGNAVRLSAAVMLLELWSGRSGKRLDLDPLRSRLGLPVPGPIDLQQTPMRSVPLVRLARVEAGKLSDEALVAAFRRAMAFGVEEAQAHLARELVARPAIAAGEERLMAFNALARTERDPDRALQYIHEGRAAAEAAGGSSASWDLLELSLRFEQGDADESMRLLQHIEREHLNEPGVGEALAQTLVEFGLIQPDGTPVVPPGAEPAAGLPAGPAAAEQAKLWTPESQKPAEAKKLWTPGMD